MSKQSKNKVDLLEVGCYFDGSRGIYIGEEVQSLAKDYGWTGEEVDSDGEFYDEAWSEAEEFLQEFCPPYSYCGGNESGDWGVWPITDDDELPRFDDVPDDFTGDAYQISDHGNVTCGYWKRGRLNKEYWSVV